MIFLRYLILILSAGIVQAQVSHADLARDLLEDMRDAIMDSSQLNGSLELTFEGDDATSSYLNQILSVPAGEGPADHLTLELIELELSIAQPSSGLVRNSNYIRQLKLSMKYEREGRMMDWHGGISDKLSKDQLPQLLDEYFPVQIKGNYLDHQPSSIRIGIASILTLALVAALYFIRT